MGSIDRTDDADRRTGVPPASSPRRCCGREVVDGARHDMAAGPSLVLIRPKCHGLSEGG